MSRTRLCGLHVVLLALVAVSVPSAARALEVDSYWAWGRPMRDSADVLDAKFDLEIRTALDALAAKHRDAPPACHDAAERIRDRLELEIFHPIALWAEQSPLIERAPADADETRDYRQENLFSDGGFLDFGMLLPPASVILVDGVYIGVDKLAHFVSSSWKYRNAYLRGLRKGLEPAEAELRAIRWGLLEERTVNGKLSTGVLSRADLEANYQGMRFYIELCEGDDPMLAVIDGAWRQVRPFDIRRHVMPEWDEGWQSSIFTDSRWRRVRPILLGYCDRLADPVVQSMLARYRAEDSDTPTEAVFRQLVEEDKIADPSRFALETNCPAAARSASPPSDPGSDAAAAWPAPIEEDEEAIAERLVALDADRRRRTFGLVGAHLARSTGVSGTLGALFARPRATDDCRMTCVATGFYTQLEAGLYGAQASVGYASLIGETGRRGRFFTKAFLGAGVELAVLRTWSGSPLDPERQTLVGVESGLSVARASLRLGLFHQVGGETAGGPWTVTGALGWGF